MKVSDAQNVSAPPPPETQKAAPKAAPPVADRVTLEQTQHADAAALAAQGLAGPERLVKLQEIAAAVKSGTYQPDPARIAEQILDSAELEARLQALLRT